MKEGLVGSEIELPDPHSEDDINFLITDRIGRGAQGTAYIIKSPTNEEYVLKIIPTEFINELKVFKKIMIEGLHPKYVVRIYAFLISDDDKIYLILERLKGSDVGTMITDFNLDETINFAQQAIKGLSYLHERDIFHRDIKPENIVWNPQTKELKYIDFGAACSVDIECPGVHGAPMYAPPDLMKMIAEDDESPDSQKGLDVYALGIVLYQLAHQTKDPFKIKGAPPISLAQLINFIEDKEQLISNTGNKELDNLINGMIENDPQKRLTIKEAQELIKNWN